MAKRNLYLETIDVDKAIHIFMTKVQDTCQVSYEKIPVIKSLGRVTKEAIYAKYSSPLFNSSAMDGIAVISKNTEGASETTPLTIEEGKDYVVVDTGDPVSFPYDAVIMAEDIIEDPDSEGVSEGKVTITGSAAPWQHVRPVGEDIVAGEMILPSKHKIRPIDVGVLLSGGIVEIQVIKKPTVAIFPTGTEIIEPTDEIKEGSIIESNSRMFENMVIEAGGSPNRFPPIEDTYEKIKEQVSKAVKNHDMVIVNAGSSAGRDDYTVHVLRELGEVLVHGVAIKPGKPVILAMVEGTPVVGLPGYPVSAYIGFENFVTPVIEYLSGTRVWGNNKVMATLSKRLVSSLKHKEYVRVKVGLVGDELVAAPLSRGAGAAMSMVRADGFCVIPQNSEGYESGEQVEVELYRPIEEVRHTLMAIGSHDLIMDVMGDMMPNKYTGNFLSSTHVGSMAGLMSLKRGEAHIAPIHLIDEETGIYNEKYIKALGENYTLIKGVGRTQGLMVKKGNPLNINSIEDLSEKDVRFVNRQRGAGTRALLDYKLKQLNIDEDTIRGYDREASTHMAVAALVASDSADVGMGILSAANAMGLDFIKIADEEYDFAIDKKHLEEPTVKHFIEILKSQEFKNHLDELGGYTYEKAGEII